VQIYSDATVRQDTAMADLAAHTIVMSAKTAFELEQGGLTLAGGIGKFAEHFSDATGDVAEMFKRFRDSKPGVDLGGRKAMAPDSKGGGGKQEIVIKWDLGDGNDEAIFMRTRREIVGAIQAAKGFVRSGPSPGMGF
jgi:hypothetical protein